MKFGIFDHVDRSDLPLAELFANRIQYVQAAEKAGFYCYHVAEHHATPLNMVPVPGVFLGAVANATTTIRLGPLVYLLPLYTPLKLIEEISILDHLSNGRLEVGVGRGVSPFELKHHNVDPATSREVFHDALEAVIYGLTHDILDHDGPYFHYAGVPMELKSLQQPHPPIWYPTSSPKSSLVSGAGGYNFSTLGSVEEAQACVDNYREAYAKHNKPFGPALDFPGGTAIGVNRHVVVAETDAEALKIAGPAYDVWYASLTKLWRVNKVQGPSIASIVIPDVETAIAKGSFIVGSPETVRAEIERQIDAIGVNYFISGMYFGNMAHAAAMRSIALFGDEVMPRLAGLGKGA